jgi:hypothetical protein
MLPCLKRGKSQLKDFLSRSLESHPRASSAKGLFSQVVEDGSESVISLRANRFLGWKKGGTAKQTPFVLL